MVRGGLIFTLIFSKTALQLVITFERIELQKWAWRHFKAFFEYFRHMTWLGWEGSRGRPWSAPNVQKKANTAMPRKGDEGKWKIKSTHYATVRDTVKWIYSTMWISETHKKGSWVRVWGAKKWPKWPKKVMTQISWIFVQWPILNATTHLYQRSCPSIHLFVHL